MKKRLKKYVIPHADNDHKPHLFRESGVIGLLIVAVALFGLSTLATEVVKRTDLVAAIYPAVLVDLTNESRLANNAPALRFNPLLKESAQLKANDMAEKGYFAHVSPDGKTPWYWFGQVGYEFVYAGENLAVDFTQSVDVERAWMNSPTHRANILNQNFTEIGIAAAEGTYKGRSTVFVTQAFGRPAVSSVIASEPNLTPGPEEDSGLIVEENSSQEEEVLGATEPSEPLSEEESNDLPELEVVEQTDTFVAVRNVSAVAESVSEADRESVKYSRWYDKFLVSPGTLVNYIYMGLLVLVLAALLLMVGIEIRKQHPKNILYGLFVIGVTVALMFLNQSLMIADIIVV